MLPTLEKRVEELEKKFDALAGQSDSNSKRNWLKTFGWSRNNEGFDEMVRLGQEYRRNLKFEDHSADS